MALVLLGKTVCQLCKKTLDEGQELTAFPAFLPNDHRYGRFSDAAFHKECIEKDPDYPEVDNMFYVWNRILKEAWEESRKMEGTLQEKEAYIAKAYEEVGWPPKNGVVVYASIDEDGKWFWSDKDMWEEFEKAEKEAHDEMEARRKEARRREREAWRYSRDD